MLLRTASTLGRRLAAASTPARHSLARPFAMTATTALGSPTTAASLEALSTQDVEARYRPYLATKNAADEPDWTAQLELDTVKDMVLRMRELQGQPEIKVLVLYGSLRERSFSRLTAYEASRVLSHIGADVRVFDPAGLPIKDGVSEKHDKVVELRALSEWSDAQLWVSPEQHGTITAVMKNQIDWIPLSVGSVRPTQGRTLAICQVNGGSQSFNTVNVLRQLGRWMRMWTIPNQSSLPKAWTQYTSSDRLMPSSNRDRLVDVCEELIKATLLLRPYVDLLGDRFSEREEKREHGRLRTQAETEAAKKASEAEKRKVDEQAKRGSEVA
ncbi:flavo protein-like protein [Rhodotorula diobovata]|uniref:Flavo protein-like protein n=1 Tax=Rhodotorula diobovata TaxID=5288 RepID=A0A5C5G138_9BASI|nr:flavo protein-like protein [Rhodotorula diobovata]